MSKDTIKDSDISKADLDAAPKAKRVPIHEQRQDLFEKESGYFYYGFPNTKHWTEKALKAGYEFVSASSASQDEENIKYATTSNSNRLTVIANPRMRDETPFTSRETVYMRIPQHLHDQDLEDRAKLATDQERVMQRASNVKKSLGMYEEYSRE